MNERRRAVVLLSVVGEVPEGIGKVSSVDERSVDLGEVEARAAWGGNDSCRKNRPRGPGREGQSDWGGVVGIKGR